MAPSEPSCRALSRDDGTAPSISANSSGRLLLHRDYTQNRLPHSHLMRYPQLTWGRDLYGDIRVRVGGNRVAAVIDDSHGGVVNQVVNDRVAGASAVEGDPRAAIASEIQQGIAFDIVAIPADDDSSASQRYLICLHGIGIPKRPDAYAEIFDRVARHYGRRGEGNSCAGGDSWCRGVSNHAVV